jgi:hypothetical protein
MVSTSLAAAMRAPVCPRLTRCITTGVTSTIVKRMRYA